MDLLGRIEPLAVEVVPGEVRPVVPVDDTCAAPGGEEVGKITREEETVRAKKLVRQSLTWVDRCQLRPTLLQEHRLGARACNEERRRL